MFGNRLKELRSYKDINQLEIANHLGISRQAYGKYENENRQPDYNTLVKIADYFDVSLDYLLGRTDVQTPYFFISEIKASDESKYFNSIILILKKNIDNLKFIYSILKLLMDNNKLF